MHFRMKNLKRYPQNHSLRDEETLQWLTAFVSAGREWMWKRSHETLHLVPPVAPYGASEGEGGCERHLSRKWIE